VKLGALNAVVPPPNSLDRHKRHAEDAFGQDRPPDYPSHALRDERQMGQNVDGVQDMANKLMAHMLGLDIPGVEPSTSFYTGCDWWARPNQDPAQPMAAPTWPQTVPASSSLFTPLAIQQRGWQPDTRDVRLQSGYNDGYQFDHFGV